MKVIPVIKKRKEKKWRNKIKDFYDIFLYISEYEKLEEKKQSVYPNFFLGNRYFRMVMHINTHQIEKKIP